MLGDFRVDNLLTSIIFRNLAFQRDVRGHKENEGLWDLERRSFKPRLDYSLPNPIEESSLKQLAKIL
jgi:hypothetical protein